jgi:chromate reductase
MGECLHNNFLKNMMKDSYHFVAISGSLRNKSYNTMVLKAAQKLAPQHIAIEQINIK